MYRPNFRLIIIFQIVFGQTEQQIQQVKDYVKKTGMSQSQVIEAAKAQGYTDQQIQEAIKNEQNKPNQNRNDKSDQDNEVKINLGTSNNEIKSKNNGQNVIVEDLPILGEEVVLEIIEDTNILSKSQVKKKEVQYFGYDIFKSDPSVFQASSVGVVDPEYLIGPGDEIIVMLWGETQFREVLKVNREGFIFIPDIGQVFVNGLNLNLLESKLFRVFSQAYSSLNPSGRKATTFLDVSLGNLRPLRIQVLGEVDQPGAYTVSPAATIFSSLYYFNGPTLLGSLRDIRLIRGDEEIASIDFYDYLLTGKTPKNEKLQLDDIIFIPKRMKTVAIYGEVNRPGVYELKSDENLLDLISIARDLKISAYLDQIQIDRIVPFDQREELGMDRKLIDLNIGKILNSNEIIELQDGDKIQIFSVVDQRQNTVQINGSVSRPGVYDIEQSMTVKELILKADSLIGDAYLDRADIIRTKPDLTQELIEINLSKAMDGDPLHNKLLESLDNVMIYGTSEMIANSYVSIIGHVQIPGRYLLQKNMTVYDLIFKSGGYVDSEYKKKAYLERAELIRVKEDGIKKEIIPFNLGFVLQREGYANEYLQPGDQIRIFSKEEIEGEKQFVTISGYVKRPGIYELYEDNMTIYDLIFKTGGFNDQLYKNNAYLDRADLIRFDKDLITKTIYPFELGAILSDKGHSANIKLQAGDEIKIYSKRVFNEVKPVFLKGSVNQVGTYDYTNNMTLKDLILTAGGFSNNISKFKIEISRINPKVVNENIFAESIIYFSDNEFNIYGQNNQLVLDVDSRLMPYDHVYVRPDPFSNMQKTVTVNGEIYYPGEYTILSPQDKISDIIDRAGGLRPNAFTLGSSYTRAGQVLMIDLSKALSKTRSRDNITVLDGDVITVLSKPNVIQISGEINTPGFYKYERGKRVWDIIDTAGGFTTNADQSDVYIKYPNGKSKKWSRFFKNRKVTDGSIIIVGEKVEEEPFDRTEYAKELTAIIASLAQAISLIVIAQR